mgnify:CR=1 FL=1
MKDAAKPRRMPQIVVVWPYVVSQEKVREKKEKEKKNKRQKKKGQKDKRKKGQKHLSAIMLSRLRKETLKYFEYTQGIYTNFALILLLFIPVTKRKEKKKKRKRKEKEKKKKRKRKNYSTLPSRLVSDVSTTKACWGLRSQSGRDAR